jgi:hypothetical protein
LPLVSVTWNRDFKLREDVSIGDEASSFTNTSLAAPGGASPKGKNWIGPKSTAVAGISVGIDKTILPLRLWGMEVGYSLPELISSQQLGRPIDSQKHEGLKLKHNLDVDEMVYIGDTDMAATGLVNNADISPASITSTWDNPSTTALMILEDINGLIELAWKNSGYAICPSELLLPPAKFALLTKPVTTAGSESILSYLAKNCLSMQQNGRPLEIKPVKWLTGRGASNKDRAVVYTNNQQFVRYPLVPLQRTPLEYRGLQQLCTYFGRLGELEFVYPETVAYADGL